MISQQNYRNYLKSFLQWNYFIDSIIRFLFFVLDNLIIKLHYVNFKLYLNSQKKYGIMAKDNAVEWRYSGFRRARLHCSVVHNWNQTTQQEETGRYVNWMCLSRKRISAFPPGWIEEKVSESHRLHCLIINSVHMSISI